MEKIEFGDALPGYEVGPQTAPALIVLQEWWGVTDIIKDQALLLSKQGFRCLVPDLYKGKVGVDAEEAHHLMSSLDFPAAIEEIKQAVQYLRDSGSPKVGVLGFCMGGALTFCSAQHAGVDAAAPFYGIPDPAICQPEAVTVPLQAHFGQLDALKGFSDPDSIKAVVEKVEAAGGSVELFMYPHSGHAFMNALTESGKAKMQMIGVPIPPSEEPETAFRRVVAFFQKQLA